MEKPRGRTYEERPDYQFPGRDFIIEHYPGRLWPELTKKEQQAVIDYIQAEAKALEYRIYFRPDYCLTCPYKKPKKGEPLPYTIEEGEV